MISQRPRQNRVAPPELTHSRDRPRLSGRNHAKSGWPRQPGAMYSDHRLGFAFLRTTGTLGDPLRSGGLRPRHRRSWPVRQPDKQKEGARCGTSALSFKGRSGLRAQYRILQSECCIGSRPHARRVLHFHVGKRRNRSEGRNLRNRAGRPFEKLVHAELERCYQLRPARSSWGILADDDGWSAERAAQPF